MATKRKKRKKRRRGAPTTKKGGVMLGMRSGFKDVANSVTGKETKKGKYSWLGTVIMVLLLGAAVLMLLKNFG